jgi:hypothetical protein
MTRRPPIDIVATYSARAAEAVVVLGLIMLALTWIALWGSVGQ